jgi:hypothetical protein
VDLRFDGQPTARCLDVGEDRPELGTQGIGFECTARPDVTSATLASVPYTRCPRRRSGQAAIAILAEKASADI